MRRFLTPDPIWDSVVMLGGFTPPSPRRLFGLLICRHTAIARYVRIDHRAGPGCFADNYEGEVCLCCARILKETKEDQANQRREALKVMGQPNTVSQVWTS